MPEAKRGREREKLREESPPREGLGAVDECMHNQMVSYQGHEKVSFNTLIRYFFVTLGIDGDAPRVPWSDPGSQHIVAASQTGKGALHTARAFNRRYQDISKARR